MRRDITSWYSERLFQEMPLVAYGHYGPPVLMVPTAAADFLEYERFYLIDSVNRWLENGRAKIYSINSVNRLALLNTGAAPWEKMEWIDRYDAYVTKEVLPLIHQDCGGADVKPILTGISLGAYVASDLFFRHPDLFGGAILLSGSYDIRGYLDGYYNENVYFHNPVEYLSNLNDDYHLPILRHGGRAIIIFSGQGAYEAPDRSRRLSDIMNSKGIPHWLDIWGHDVNHDWPWWRKAMPYYFGKLFGD
ncbi:MAG TPA: alpha/beta hydrolase-fold protein [Blastocatellia bacterium]|nr:alpha/beta hydrolase-fold protein [Blastocatellia bacterium]